jgi:hypothetical protein
VQGKIARVRAPEQVFIRIETITIREKLTEKAFI